MKKLGGTDFMEVLTAAGKSAGTPASAVYNPLVHPDARAQMMIDVIRMWGMSVLFADALRDEEKTKPMAIHDFIFRCAEVVDSTYNELERRGWTVRLQSAVVDDEE